MNFATFCSGIAAPECAWSKLGWHPQFFSEVDPFASAVLAHHYPDVPNLGDMEALTREEVQRFSADVVCAGTPCQSFSVAGLRGGMVDPRGNLALVFLRLVDYLRPRWVVWENVPGVLSSNGGDDFRSFLDALECIGYIPDVEIIDAQFCGVPQRRRRVFVCAQSREDLLSKKTDSSVSTIAQCLVEILHGVCAAEFIKSGSEPASSDSPSLSSDGVRRRIGLFDLLSNGESNFAIFTDHLAEASLRYPAEPKNSDSVSSARARGSTAGGRSSDSKKVPRSSFTASGWLSILAEAWNVVKSFTTSTRTNSITPSEIFTCSQACLSIAKLIARLNRSCQCYWSAASSALIALRGFTDYARHTSSSLFGDMGRVQSWHDFVREAEPTIRTLGSVRAEPFAGTILPLADCLSGHPAPSRETGQGTSRSVAASLGSSGAGTSRVGDTRGQDNVVCATNFGERDTSTCLTNKQQRLDPDTETFVVLHSLRADGFDGTMVRRLTPRECERLQGFQDDWTLIPYRGKPAADGSRYRAIGNSMCVNVMQWLGQRIEHVQAVLDTEMKGGRRAI